MHRLAGRAAAVAMHAAYVVAGVIAFLSPTQTVESHVAWGVYLWASMFTVGGAVGVYGAWSRRWITERTALYPLMGASGVYALSLYARYGADHRAVALFLAVIFTALVATLGVRHSELTRISRATARRERR